MERPSWDDYFKEIVLVTAKRSPCDDTCRCYCNYNRI